MSKNKSEQFGKKKPKLAWYWKLLIYGFFITFIVLTAFYFLGRPSELKESADQQDSLILECKELKNVTKIENGFKEVLRTINNMNITDILFDELEVYETVENHPEYSLPYNIRCVFQSNETKPLEKTTVYENGTIIDEITPEEWVGSHWMCSFNYNRTESICVVSCSKNNSICKWFDDDGFVVKEGKDCEYGQIFEEFENAEKREDCYMNDEMKYVCYQGDGFTCSEYIK